MGLQREGENWREREIDSTCWFILQMVAAVRTGPVSLTPGTWNLLWVSRVGAGAGGATICCFSRQVSKEWD